MPRLDNVDVKYYNGRLIDKETENIVYFDDTHEYIDKNDNLKGISVTTMIHSYTNPFDSNFWSSYKALEALCEPEVFSLLKEQLLKTKKINYQSLDKFVNINDFNDKKKEILKNYELENKKSCEYGTMIHKQMENSIYSKDTKILKKFGLGGKMSVFSNSNNLNLVNGIYPEFMLSYRDNDFLLCGQTDLLIIDDNEITIIDYKTNKKLDFKSFYDKYKKSSINMKYPLNKIQDCNGNHYTLQLSTYAWILQQYNSNYNIKNLTIDWIDHNGKETFFNVPYLKTEVEKMIKDYQKKLKIKKALERNEPYII